MIEKIILARHQGFCMGVKRAIRIAQKTAEERLPDNRVTILKEIVHNEAVVEDFRCRGVGQQYEVEDVAEGTLIISAHGVSPDVIDAARKQGLQVVDATCPLVTRIYRTILDAIDKGFHIVHFGDPDHDETAGIVGHAPDKITVVASLAELQRLPDWPDRTLGITVQTTAHVDLYEDIRQVALAKWPQIKMFRTICNATTQRQQAIVELAPLVDMILVVGSQTSANSKRLVQISQSACGNGRLIGTSNDIDATWFDQHLKTVGVSAGASTPQFLVDQVMNRLIEISGGTAQLDKQPGPPTESDDHV